MHFIGDDALIAANMSTFRSCKARLRFSRLPPALSWLENTRYRVPIAQKMRVGRRLSGSFVIYQATLQTLFFRLGLVERRQEITGQQPVLAEQAGILEHLKIRQIPQGFEAEL